MDQTPVRLNESCFDGWYFVRLAADVCGLCGRAGRATDFAAKQGNYGKVSLFCPSLASRTVYYKLFSHRNQGGRDGKPCSRSDGRKEKHWRSIAMSDVLTDRPAA